MSIGNYAVVGTGSVVGSDVPEYAVVAGNPARLLKERARIPYDYVPAEASARAMEIWRRAAPANHRARSTRRTGDRPRAAITRRGGRSPTG